jgi:2,3-bisphosphoglycerate-independent phosphoglycerate mutase
MLFDIFKKGLTNITPQEGARIHSLKIKPLVLLILDGFGIAPESVGNAIAEAKTPNLNNFKTNYPNSVLIAAGESVGLPANEAGNSEVGHLTIGAGRVIYQSLPKIDMSIKDGSFFENNALLSALAHVRKNNSRLHIMGLVSSGSVHSSINHFYALLQFCQKHNFSNVALHLFTDGRDAPPKDAINVVSKIESYLNNTKCAQIATISGRYWAMDRDARWERTKKAYEAIVSSIGDQASSAVEVIKASYERGITDEFIEPTVITVNGSPVGGVNDNDAVIFFNFRIDRPRQLTMAFVFPNFEELKYVEFGYTPHGKQKAKKEGEKATGPTFKRSKWPRNVCFVTMTEYQKNLPVSAIAFPPEIINGTLAESISKAGLRQLHLTESEKERMVTFYFDGLKDEKFVGEDTDIVPSPNVATYDRKPEMSVNKIVEEFKKAVLKDYYHFFVINFANPDMVAHSGNIKATIKAIEAVDKALGLLVDITLLSSGCVMVTADHGNAEELLTFPIGTFFFTTSKGSVNTEHSNNPVPFYLIDSRFKGRTDILEGGSLADIAPTVLDIMGLPIPKLMTGKSLLKKTTEFTAINVSRVS